MPPLDHPLADELREADAVLLLHPEWAEWVEEDLTRGRGLSARKGRRGMPAHQVLRACYLQRRLNVSVRKLAKLIPDSLVFREFLGLGTEDPPPKRSTLQGNLRRVRPETWGRINRGFLQSAEAREFESGEKVRVDCTVTETTIHHPSDSSLLWDGVRALTRLMGRARVRFVEIEFEDRSKPAKAAHTKIYWAKKKAQRVPVYEVLVEEARRVRGEAQRVVETLPEVELRQVTDVAVRNQLIRDLEHYLDLLDRVVDQTVRRVFNGETVPASEKVYSVFEPHTDMIKKGQNRSPEFGHKLTLTLGVNFVRDCVIERGNPADVTLAVRQIERQKELNGLAPKQAAFDGGFASAENLTEIKGLGTERCAFSKPRGLSPEDMAGSRRTFGRLKRFRAGVEGKISWLKRDFGLGRCTLKGWDGFQSYVWSACFAANLSKLVRLRLAKRAPARRRRAAA